MRRFLRYGVPAASCLIALAATILFKAHIDNSVFLLFWPAVIVAALYGGIISGLLASIFAVASVEYFVVAPIHEFDWAKLVGHPVIPVFLITSGFVGWLSDSLRMQRLKAESAASEARGLATQLEEQAVELEHQLEESQALQEELEQSSSELTEMNLELDRSREFLEQAQTRANLGSWEWDVSTNAVTWSSQLYRVYGLEPGGDALTYDSFLQMVHPDDRSRLDAAVRDAFEQRGSFALDHRIVRSDGALRWVHGSGTVMVNAKGDPVRVVGSGQDITERRALEDSQRLLQEASAALSSSLDVAVTLETLATLIVKELADWCMVALGDETGNHRIAAAAHRDPSLAHWVHEYNRLRPPLLDSPRGPAQVLRSGRSELYSNFSIEEVLLPQVSAEGRRALEQLKVQSVMVVPMIARGKVRGAISFLSSLDGRRYSTDDLRLAEELANRAAIAIDNAELFESARAARKRAEEANRVKMEFLAAMSHELRTPLNSMTGYAELLEMNLYGSLTEPQREVLGRMRRSQRHLQGLIEDVLGFAKLEAGRLRFDIRTTRVDETLSRMGDLIAAQCLAKDIRYEYIGCDEAVSVEADRERLEQIVLNLLGNAVKFTPAGGRITLGAVANGEHVTISVADTGVGIPAEKLEAGFEPFVQLSTNRVTGQTGTGLGLAISRDLARAMHGEVVAASVVGAGSTFSLTLPRAGVVRAGARADQSSQFSNHDAPSVA